MARRRYAEWEIDEHVLARQIERARERQADPAWELVEDEYSDIFGPTWRHKDR